MSEERHKNVIEILRLELKNQQDEYTLDMAEMYALIDGFARDRERIEKLESALRQTAESTYENAMRRQIWNSSSQLS